MMSTRRPLELRNCAAFARFKNDVDRVAYVHSQRTFTDDVRHHARRIIEVYHSEHDAETSARYRQLAESLHLAITGGSDYHGDDRAERARLGRVTTAQEDFDRLLERVRRR